MDNEPATKIEQLQADRERQIALIEAAKAEIERIDKVIEAYDILVHAAILPPANGAPRIRKKPDELEKAVQNGGRAAIRDAEVDSALERIGDKSFTVSDIVTLTGLGRRRVMRSLEEKVQAHEIRITRTGHRGKAGRYKMIKSESG